jgi:hypothetical protein
MTLDYRGIQGSFEQAVELDNGRSVSAFTESSVFTEPGYGDVAAQLTPEYIQKLDQRLRPNAWLLLSASQWRMGKLTEARESAQKGLKEPALQKQSRDHVLLLMIPGLVIDMEIEKTWKEAGMKFTLAQYAKVERNYVTVFDLFSDAEKAMGPATPPNTRHYLSYQRWRVVQGWRSVINSIDAGNDQQDNDAQNDALKEAGKQFSGKSLQEVAKNLESSIPEGNSLRDLIAAQSR